MMDDVFSAFTGKQKGSAEHSFRLLAGFLISSSENILRVEFRLTKPQPPGPPVVVYNV